ncbi:hypothetical protein GQ53DRAFT_413818 [Thozetella sp. PMI_491]|nr:hypothetical protein GQ53DRAFT_413818 [Thozetella sp. PMI_491]
MKGTDSNDLGFVGLQRAVGLEGGRRRWPISRFRLPVFQGSEEAQFHEPVAARESACLMAYHGSACRPLTLLRSRFANLHPPKRHRHGALSKEAPRLDQGRHRTSGHASLRARRDMSKGRDRGRCALVPATSLHVPCHCLWRSCALQMRTLFLLNH